MPTKTTMVMSIPIRPMDTSSRLFEKLLTDAEAVPRSPLSPLQGGTVPAVPFFLRHRRIPNEA